MLPRIALHPTHGPELSRLVYGVWRLADASDTSSKHVREKIDACLAQGITSFDHADIYGDYTCEQVFGQALAADPGLRQRIELISKCDIALISDKYPNRRVKYYDTSAAYIQGQVEQSLKHLHTDYLDCLLIHRPDPFMDAKETGAALDALISQGKVRSVGVSNFAPWDFDLLQSAMQNPLVTNQLEMSVLQRDVFTNGALAQSQRLGIRPMAWSPLAGGELFSSNNAAAQRVMPVLQRLAQAQEADNIAVEHIALAWLLAHPAGIIPVVGTNNMARIQQLHAAMSVSLEREDWFEIWTAAAGQEVP